MSERKLKKEDYSLQGFKNALGIKDVPDKPLRWIPLSDGFAQATGLQGIPMGYTTLFRGHSNTGKSTSLLEAAVSCQKNGILPIIIDIENNLSESHLENLGFDFSKEYILVRNTDIYKAITVHKNKKELKDISIECLADFIDLILDQHAAGNIQQDICILLDSIGTVDCINSQLAKEKDKNSNNMWNAGAAEACFKGILNNRIPATRREDYGKYTVTFAAVQKIWLQIPQVGQPIVKHKWGETFYYGSRLIIHYGGTISSGVKKVSLTNKGREIDFGFITKVSVAKNQVTGVSFAGELFNTPHGFIINDKYHIDKYKKENKQFLEQMLNIEGDFDFKEKKESSDFSVESED